MESEETQMKIRQLIARLEALSEPQKELPANFAYWTEEEDAKDSWLRVVEIDKVLVSHGEIQFKSLY